MVLGAFYSLLSYVTTLYFGERLHILVSTVHAMIFRSAIRRPNSVWTAWVGKVARKLDCFHAMAWVVTR